jgi:hypothetical protein
VRDCRRIRTVRRSRSRSFRVNAVISPQRSDANVLSKQERLPPIGHQVDKGIELVEGQHRPVAGPFRAGALIRHGLTMINSSSVTAVFKIARRYDLATIVEETRLRAARRATHAKWLCRADRAVSRRVLGRCAGE